MCKNVSDFKGYACPHCTELKEGFPIPSLLKMVQPAQTWKRRNETAVISESVQEPSNAIQRARQIIPLFCAKGNQKEKHATNTAFQRSDIHDLPKGCEVEMFWHLDLQWYREQIRRVPHTENRCEVDVLYEDGDSETIQDFSSSIWRKIRIGYVNPAQLIGMSLEYQNAYDTVLKIIQNEERRKHPRDIMVTQGENGLLRINFKSLLPNQWLTDAVIESFILKMMRTGTHEQDLRFLLLS
ncbi:hypothetical protein FGB62_272g05 [Gracilaria domingensis]|nr:hypothetical protein FGB62_272g05 [Gracilaria domingensis]